MNVKKDSFLESTIFFKETIPLMMQYKVPVTPINYAIWYTYVNKTHPELNRALDKGISVPGRNADSLCDSLYDEFLINEKEKKISKIKNNLVVIAEDLFKNTNSALMDAELFQDAVMKSLCDIEKLDKEGVSISDSMDVVRELIHGIGEIRNSTNKLKENLTENKNEILQLRSQLETSKKEAREDALTGLLNRRMLDESLLNYINKKDKFSFVMIDVDHFKSFNDEYGHLFGDKVLRLIANKIKERCYDSAESYRFGGEEFAVILPGKDILSARQHAETIRKTLEKISISDRKSGKKVRMITASFGVTQVIVGDTVQSIIERADGNLLKAKSNGRNCVMPRSEL